ncbi:AAA family ATPase [Achromobacter denitrificans]|uniref:AAA family ATPase n=1 Tax=Achromobacter denitrificans TaxID=32002 RepID=A0A6N0JR32_ACHDE|nr:AAA family ATPase [Achromobacter denitrificans]QKQ49585.1 AAA family ATPase [Achromobacter denitrificans]
MHLHSLTLINVRQFKQRTFEFRPGFNLLVGENGAGKTTILRGLLAALGGARKVGQRPGLEDDDIRLRTHRAEVNAVVQSEKNELKQYKFQKSLWERANRSARRGDLPLVLLYSSNEAVCSAMKMKRTTQIRDVDSEQFRSNEEFLYATERDSFHGSTGANDRQFGNSRSVREFVGKVLSTFSPDMDAFYWHFEPYDCSIVPAEGTEKNGALDAETQKQARLFAMRKFQEGRAQRRQRPFDWPDQAKVVLTPEISERKRGDRNLPYLREVWEGMKFSSEATRELLLSCSLEVRLTPRIMIKRRMGTLSLKQLSDGEQRLFSLFVDIARQLSINRPSDTFGEGKAIILIDEIDVHLHPKWQRRIVPALEDLFSNCQFIATTHSPFVIQAVGRQRITFIEPHPSAGFLGGGNSLEDIAEDIQGVAQPQRSVRAEILSSAAKRYFTLLEMRAVDVSQVDSADLRAAERSYREASEPFTTDPALHALLEVMVMEGKTP